MKSRLLGSFLSIFSCLLACGCTLKTVDTLKIGDMTTVDSKVLIATQASQFKDEVVAEIKKALGQNVFYIKVLDVKWLPSQSVDDYNAIVVLNRCMAGRTHGWRILSIIYRIKINWWC